jgi:flagellar motor switch protein FliM
MSEILTQEEIDSLLQAVTKGELPQDSEPRPRPRRHQTVQVYDFHHQNRISKDQVRTLQMLHQTFSRAVSSSLSAYLRIVVEVQLTSVEQPTFGEFMVSLPSPSVSGIFEMPPLKGGALFDMDPRLVFPMIDRILGGAGRASIQVRELTEIERTLVVRLFRRLLGDLQQAWSQIGRFDIRLLKVETNPQFIQLTPPNDIALLVMFDVRMGEVSGMMSMCFPFPMLEPILSKLMAQRWLGSPGAGHAGGASPEMHGHLQSARLGLRAVLEPIHIPVERLNALQPGDIIPLPHVPLSSAGLAGGHDLPVTVEVAGHPRFVGRVGQRQRRRAVEITGVLDAPGGAHG